MNDSIFSVLRELATFNKRNAALEGRKITNWNMKQAMKRKSDVGMQEPAKPIEGLSETFVNPGEHGGSLAL
jgi:hypothetical protein